MLVIGDIVDDLLVRPLTAVTPASDTTAEIRHRPGGSAANVAGWLGALGVDVSFVGRAGHNSAGEHVSVLHRQGVDARIAVDRERTTGSIVLVLDEHGERTMYVDRSANTGLTLRDIPDDVWHDVAVLHLTGYTFFDPATRPVALGAIATARRRHVAVSVDPSSAAYLRAAGAGNFLEWTAGVDALLPNAVEAELLTGLTDAGAAAAQLASTCSTAAVKLGWGGAVVRTAEGDELRADAVPADVRDSTGAGDGFAAGWIAAWVRGEDLAGRLASGLEVSARAVTVLGGRPH
ncbi:PfkB family carbohydrate kinase [soil metagenome]